MDRIPDHGVQIGPAYDQNFSRLAETRQLFGQEVRAFALIGLLGGFTTFSTFGYETFAMVRAEEYVRAVSNIGMHVGLGVTLVWIGYLITASR